MKTFSNSLRTLRRIYSEPEVEDLCWWSGFNMTGIQRYGSVLSLSKLYIQVKEIRLEGEAAYLNLERYSLCGVFRKSSSQQFQLTFQAAGKESVIQHPCDENKH